MDKFLISTFNSHINTESIGFKSILSKMLYVVSFFTTYNQQLITFPI